MNTLELKRRITTLAGLPRFPESMCPFFDPLRSGPELRAEAAVHPSASAAVVREDQAWHGASTSFHDAWERLGPGGARAALALDILRGLFPAANARRLDAAAAHRHAQCAARIAVRLVRLVDAPLAELAPAAAALHDAGRFALDAVAEEGYPGDWLQYAHGLGALEAERREIGVEHTLAGKWLCEAWELPAEFGQAAWLHHHPPDSLAATSYPLALIDLVALSNEFAHAVGAGRAVAAARMGRASLRRIERLDIEPGAVEEALADLSGDVAPPEAVAVRPEAVSGGPPTEELRRARKETTQYKALHGMNLQVGHTAGADEILDAAASVVRGTFGIQAGFCFAEAGDESGWVCRLWRPGSDDCERIRLSGAPDADGEQARQARALLERLPSAAPIVEDSAVAALMRHGGLIGIPFLAGGRRYGQLVFEADAPGTSIDNADLETLTAFAQACGVALARAALESRLRREAEEMGAAVWQRELAHQQNLRRERLSGIGRMAAGAAHEINNPLAIISGRAQILLSRAAGPEETRALEAIIQQSRRASKILIDLMQFARRAEPRLEAVAVHPLLRKVADSMRDRLEEKRIRVIEDFAQDAPRVRADHRQMEQVFVNVILNAEQAMPDGGTLTLRTRALSDARAVAVRISDTGAGIAAEVLDQVFEPFYTTLTDGEHTGLGLAVCHGIVENHQGTITLQSAPGEGTTCTITLPAAAEAARPGEEPAAEQTLAQRAAPKPNSKQAAPLTVLVAEEDDALREIVAQTLRREGCTVHVAEDGLEAVAAVLSQELGLAILAHPLAAVEGQPPLQFVRDRRPELPIIAMAAPGSADALREALEFGASRCLQKPFNIDQLLSQVRAYRKQEDVA